MRNLKYLIILVLGGALFYACEKENPTPTNNGQVNPCYIELSTQKEIGDTILLGLGAKEVDREAVWVDLNNNGVKDSGEGNLNLGTIEDDNQYRYNRLVLGAKTIKIHGKVDLLECYKNQLINLDASKNINLEILDCSGNLFTNLDMSKNVNLESLVCHKNQLSNLNVSKNINLKKLICVDNPLTSLDVSKNVNLKILICWGNQLSDLDVSKNINLEWLDCFNNQLTALDVSKNVNLKGLDCAYNFLNSLDVSNNTHLKRLHYYQNPDLNCIQVNSEQLSDIPGTWVSHNDAIYSLDCNN